MRAMWHACYVAYVLCGVVVFSTRPTLYLDQQFLSNSEHITRKRCDAEKSRRSGVTGSDSGQGYTRQDSRTHGLGAPLGRAIEVGRQSIQAPMPNVSSVDLWG